MYFVREFGADASQSFTPLTSSTLFIKNNPDIFGGEIAMKSVGFSEFIMMEDDGLDQFQGLGSVYLHIIRAL